MIEPSKQSAFDKIADGLTETLRVKTLINAVSELSGGREMTEQQAVAVLARIDTAQTGRQQADEWDDRRDQWSELIDRAHPVNSGRHDAYETARAMVGNRQSKSALVNLVCWLLQGQAKGRR